MKVATFEVTASVLTPDGVTVNDYFVGVFRSPMTRQEIELIVRRTYPEGKVLKVVNKETTTARRVMFVNDSPPVKDTRTSREVYGKAKRKVRK
jgi:hypothetical protein